MRNLYCTFTLGKCVGALFILLSVHSLIFAQVSIRERIVLFPGLKMSPPNKTASFPIGPADTAECTIALIHDNPFYIDTAAPGITWDGASTFQVTPADTHKVLLHGGALIGLFLPNGRVVGIGADDSLTVDINGVRVVNFGFSPSGIFLDPTDAGLDIHQYVHLGTNSYHARAWETIPGDDFGVPPLRITSPTDLRYRVTFAPDTIQYGDTSKITVTAVDANNNPVIIPDTTHLMFTIVQEVDTVWGLFIDQAGNINYSPLQNMTYGDAKAGRIRFLASSSWNDSLGGLRPVIVKVDGGHRVGINTIYLGTVTLKFDGLDTMEVFPHNPLPLPNNSTDRKDTVELTLKSRYGSSNAIATNVNIKIGLATVVDSGGHRHDNVANPLPRPHGKYEWKNGTQWSTQPVDSLQQKTDGTGSLILRFLATEVGGIEQVKAIQVKSAGQTGPETHAFKRIKTRVPNLVILPTSENYYQTGGTNVHHGPRVDTQFQGYRTPNDNHYIEASLVALFDSAASGFKNDHGNHTGRMRINDFSLQYGGILDIDGHWHVPHSWHRIGRDVDIENMNITLLKRYLSRRGWTYVPEGPTFYPHFRKVN